MYKNRLIVLLLLLLFVVCFVYSQHLYVGPFEDEDEAVENEIEESTGHVVLDRMPDTLPNEAKPKNILDLFWKGLQRHRFLEEEQDVDEDDLEDSIIE